MEIRRVRLSLGDRFLDKKRINCRRLLESVYKYTLIVNQWDERGAAWRLCVFVSVWVIDSFIKYL